MEKLKIKDIEKYMESGFLTKPFLDNEFIKRKVDLDFNAKIINNANYTKIESLYHWINHIIKFSKDDTFVSNNKFQRTAQEIWESGFAVGCSDYAILFATFARQIGWATTILATAELNWIKDLHEGKNSRHSGHYFCECYYDGKWVLVDPTCKKIENNYRLDKLNLSYTIHNSNIYYPYLRCLDLGKKQTIKEHNIEMDKICKKIKLEQ